MLEAIRQVFKVIENWTDYQIRLMFTINLKYFVTFNVLNVTHIVYRTF